ncbi:transporter [Staphylococcus casei]|uniref:LysE family transporter n=1 Tax=Staphylococcus TaxID=1279 RepID=UPI000CD2BFE7|nr:LysE family transporter [Staphylococcus casei]PNZ59000.1 transporter [Staphylococcus casei]PTI78227.1 transporter [Staphylococcus succinus]WJE86581.1 LysE family transporter [Staphylococcus casei]
MFISFIIYTLFMSYTPGPNNLLALDGALRLGIRGTLRFLIGIGLGFLSLSFICLLFSTYVASYFDKFIIIIKVVGFIYLLYLAYSVFMHKQSDPHNHNCYRLRDGLYLQYVNPKTIVYIITAIITYITSQTTGIFISISYTLIIALIGVSGAITWALMGLCFKRWILKYNLFYKIFMASCLVILACMMIFE